MDINQTTEPAAADGGAAADQTNASQQTADNNGSQQTQQAQTSDTAAGAKKSVGWMAQLPDDLKANETLAGFATVGELGTKFLELHGKLDQSLPLLPENATDEQKAEFYGKLGRPEKPEGYAVDKAQIPNWGPIDDVLDAAMRPQMHQLGITNAQYEGLAKGLAAVNAQLAAENAKATKAAYDAMTQEFGAQTQAKMEQAARVADKIGGQDLKNLLETVDVDGVRLGNHPAIVKAMLSVASAVLDDSFVAGDFAAGRTAQEDGVLDYS